MSIGAIWLFLLHVGLISKGSHATYDKLAFKRTGDSESFADVACAIEMYADARGVRYDTQTKECIKLSDSWFSDKIEETEYSYALMQSYELLFHETLTEMWTLPKQFDVGSTVSVDINTKSKGPPIAFRFVVSTSPEFYAASIGIRYDRNVVTFNDFRNNNWGPESELSIFRLSTDTDYRIKITMTSAFYDMYIGDYHVGHFTRRYQTTDPVFFQVGSSRTVCLRVQYTFDV